MLLDGHNLLMTRVQSVSHMPSKTPTLSFWACEWHRQLHSHRQVCLPLNPTSRHCSFPVLSVFFVTLGKVREHVILKTNQNRFRMCPSENMHAASSSPNADLSLSLSLFLSQFSTTTNRRNINFKMADLLKKRFFLSCMDYSTYNVCRATQKKATHWWPYLLVEQLYDIQQSLMIHGAQACNYIMLHNKSIEK